MRIQLSRLRQVFIISTILTLTLQVAPSQAVSWKLPFVDLAQQSVSQGGTVAVSFGVLYPSRCSLWLQNSISKSKSKSYWVSQSQKTVSLSTSGLKTGKYQVRVSCGSSGRSGKGVSDDIWIIAKGLPTAATCTLVGQGFSPIKRAGVSYGAELKNLSPVLTAVGVAVVVTFQNSMGITVSSARHLPMEVAPGDSVYVGGADFGEGIVGMRVEATCDSSLDLPEGRIKGFGAITALTDPVYSARVAGEVVNTKSFTVAEYSPVSYLLRDSKGAITGGGSTYMGLLLLSKARGSWKVDSYTDPAQVSTILWILDPMKG